MGIAPMVLIASVLPARWAKAAGIDSNAAAKKDVNLVIGAL
jgi:hypothetical protein